MDVHHKIIKDFSDKILLCFVMLTNKGKLNLEKGDRYWTDLSIKGTWIQSPKQTYSKKVKVNPKTIHKSDLYKVRPSTRKQTEDAHVERLKLNSKEDLLQNGISLSIFLIG